MRTVRSLFYSVFFISLIAGSLGAQKLVYPPSDPAKDIAAALTAAKTDKKNVLIDFGADWCPDCRVLGALFDDREIAPFIDENFHVIHVDVGRRDKNADIAAKYGATSGDWIPAVVVLDPDGKTVGVTNDQLRLTRRDTPATLLPVLKGWAPKRLIAPPSSFTENGVHVTLTIEGTPARAAFLSATFAPIDGDVHLYSKDLPRDGISGLGRPTRIDADASSSIQMTGPAVADRPIQHDVIPALNVSVPIYPAGPVTLRVPVTRNGRGPAVFRVSYMGCGLRGCLAPVIDRAMSMTLATSAPGR